MANRRKDGSLLDVSNPITEFGHENFNDDSVDLDIQGKFLDYNDMQRRFKKADWGSG
jgi:hypothetical protein